MTQTTGSWWDKDLVLSPESNPQGVPTSLDVLSYWLRAHYSKIKRLADAEGVSVQKWLSSWLAAQPLTQINTPADPPPSASSSHILNVGLLSVDEVSHQVRYNHRPRPLPPREYALLITLMRNPGQVVPYEAIAQSMWGRPIMFRSDKNAINVSMRHLREQLGITKDGVIQTVIEQGYRLIE